MESKHSHILLWLFSGLSIGAITILALKTKKSNQLIKDQSEKISDLTKKIDELSKRKTLQQP